MKRPEAALQLLWSLHQTHLPVDVEEPDPIVGQLQQSFELLLQVAHRLLQAEADCLHSIAQANVHHGAAGAQVHLGQWRQLAVLGDKNMVPRRKEAHIRTLTGSAYQDRKQNKSSSSSGPV